MVNATSNNASARSHIQQSSVRNGGGYRSLASLVARDRASSSYTSLSEQTGLFGLRDMSLDFQVGPQRPDASSDDTLDRHGATRQRTSQLSEDSTPIAQMLNTESRTRLMVARLHDLISQLCDMRVRAVGLTEVPASHSSRALQSSLSGLNSSLVLLDSAIKDLEERVTGTARRLNRVSSRPISDWNLTTNFPWDSDIATGVPLQQTPLSRLRSDHSISNFDRGDFRESGTLQARLGQFSESLTNLNSRLDRVANNFRHMQEYRDRSAQSVSSLESTNPLSFSLSAHAMELEQDPDRRLWNSFLDSERTLPLPPAVPRLVHSLELSPEELELQSRIAQTTSENNYPGSWTSDLSSGLLGIGRRQLERNQRAAERERLGIVEHSLTQAEENPRMQELTLESSAARVLDRQHQEEVLKETGPPSRKDMSMSSHCKIEKPCSDVFDFPLPKLSSHVPLNKDQERIFVDGVEYRNCLGLWLSFTGEEAPQSAVPGYKELDPHAMEE